MSFPERPPLDPYICEKIDAELHKFDGLYWPKMTAMRVKTYYAPDEPVPPPQPQHLLHEIEWYAERLFKVEADYYDQFRNDVSYGGWLSCLAARTTARVMKNLETLEGGVPGTMIVAYHGLTKPRIEQHLLLSLSKHQRQYEQGTSESQSGAAALSSTTKDAYAKAGIDLSAAPPLVKMAIAAHAIAPTHTQRRAAIEPLLQEKGWSVLDWAMAANVSHATAMDFLNEKTNPYRSTRLKLAKALGIPVGRLPQ